MNRKILFAVLSAAVFLSAGGPARAAEAPAGGASGRAKTQGSRPCVLILSYFTPEELAPMLRSAAKAGFPAGSRVIVGTYGVSKETALKVKAAGSMFGYAPMFTLDNENMLEKRRLDEASEKTLGGEDGQLAKTIPPLTRVLTMAPAVRRNWGLELGRRMRDNIRAARKAGAPIASWQFDEIRSQCASSQAYREYSEAVLNGLANGRKKLGDSPMRGVIWIANKALPLAGARGADIDRYWAVLDKTASWIVAEEYPVFSGSAAQKASAAYEFQKDLRKAGGARGRAAGKYLAGLSPGYLSLELGVGGVQGGTGRFKVRDWRQDYIRARACEGVDGFGIFNFMGGNAKPIVIADVINDIAIGFRTAKCK